MNEKLMVNKKYLPRKWRYIKLLLFGVRCSECGKKLITSEILMHRNVGITHKEEMACQGCWMKEAHADKYDAPF